MRKTIFWSRALLTGLIVLACMACGVSGGYLAAYAKDLRAQRILHAELLERHRTAAANNSSPAAQPGAATPGKPAAGWLSIHALGLEEPVLPGGDNQFYLTHNARGTFSRFGALFYDHRQSPGGALLTVYGHNFGNGMMFGALSRYRNEEFLRANPMLTLQFTNTGASPYPDSFRIVAAALLKGDGTDMPELFGLAPPRDAAALAAAFRARALAKTELPVDARAKLLCLVTCAYDFPQARLVVLAVSEE